MAGKARGSASVVILIFLLIVAIIVAAFGFIGLQKEKQHSAELSEEIAQLEIKKRSTEKEITNLKERVSDLKRQADEQQVKIQDFNTQITSLNEELSLEKKAKEQAISEFEGFREELNTLRSAKSNLESELKISNEALSSLKDKLAAFEAAAEETLPKNPAAEAPPNVQLDKIVISQGETDQTVAAQAQSAALAPSLEGKVLVVNKEYDFIVVDLGKKDNINVGDTLEILRKDKKIGIAKIEEVRDTMSVAMPATQGMIKHIKEDDRAVRK